MSKKSRGPTQQLIGPGLVHVALAAWLICFSDLISHTSRWKHVTSAEDWLVRMLKESCQPDAAAWLKGGVFPFVFMFQGAVKIQFLSSSCAVFQQVRYDFTSSTVVILLCGQPLPLVKTSR